MEVVGILFRSCRVWIYSNITDFLSHCEKQSYNGAGSVNVQKEGMKICNDIYALKKNWMKL